MTNEHAEPFYIVGLGASAGGLKSLISFFEPMPARTGLAFIVVTHQHPDHESLMPELLGRHTVLPVVEARDGMLVEPDHVYLSAPGSKLVLVGGTLRDRRAEVDASTPHSRQPVDDLLRSLAEDAKQRAIAVILSGTGADGSVGAKLIKRELGLVMAEDPDTATYAGMPRSIIDAGLADFIDTAAALGRRLVAYAQRRTSNRIGPSDDEQRQRELHDALALVRDHTGHDFSSYKESTIRRRIERRMDLLQIDALPDYTRYLQKTPTELDTLFREFLIGVTSFFRDPDAFAALADALTQLLERRRDNETVRVWVPGCSTGEEAYSIAIVLREVMTTLSKQVDVQIFATDLDAAAIDVARIGAYPESIAMDVGEDRLARFFILEEGSYRICKAVRDTVIFATHNVLNDPPFTRLDLLSCRNLLIYLDSSLQRRLLPLFHYALKPYGLLFLGTSESVGGFTELFAPLDKKVKVFVRMPAERHPVRRFPNISAGGKLEVMAHRPHEAPIGQLVETMLIAQYVPPSVIVNERGTIVHIHGRTGKFFEPAPGQPSLNLIDMAREGLQSALTTCLRQVSNSDAEVRLAGVRVRTNGTHILADISARRLLEPEALRGLILFTFRQDVPESERATSASAPQILGDMASMHALERELRHTKETLHSTVEEYETTNEELKSTNEELQSTNEELQSTNEELETSKEELQSLNEELQTVNSELEEKVASLSQAKDDMTNLLNSTEIATVFLDKDLRIKRFTDSAVKLIKLIRTDIGRPIGDLASELHYDTLVHDAEQVNRTLIHKERELQSKDGQWFLMRMVPYRTTDNVIDGVVLTFVDVTEQKRASTELLRAQAEVRHSEDILGIVLASTPIRITVARVDHDLRYTWICNPHPDFDIHAMLGKRDDEISDDEGALQLLALKRRVLDGEGELQSITFTTSDGPTTFRVYAEPVRDPDDVVVGVSTVAIEATSPAGHEPGGVV